MSAARNRKRHPVLATIAGFFLGLFLALDLLLLGIVPLQSIVLTLLPVLGLVLGLVLGRMAPLRRRTAAVASDG